MILVVHRRNAIADLRATDVKYGVEIDIRSQGQQLIVQHDPFMGGDGLDNWLDHYRHAFVILNTKEEGLEKRLIALMRSRGVDNYFLLDQSFPFLVRWADMGEHRAAVRVSEFETIATALALAGKVDWVWVDCFTKFPLTRHDAFVLNEAGFKLCLVSPELHGRDSATEIPRLYGVLRESGIVVDAVCTKRPDLWEIEMGR